MLVDYYLDELKAAPGVLKCIGTGKQLVLTGRDGGAHLKQAMDVSWQSPDPLSPRR